MDYWTAASGLVPALGAPLRCGSASGIVVNLQGRTGAGVDWLDIHRLELAGVNGDLTVWSSPGGWAGKLDQANEWVRHYKQAHANSGNPRTKVGVDLEVPIRVRAGEVMGLYVHTTGWGGMVVRGPRGGSLQLALRLRNADRACSMHPPAVPFSKRHMLVSSGCAKTWSPAPFGEVRQWALLRELNGILIYRVKWRAWTLASHPLFPPRHRWAAERVRVALCCGSRGLPRIAVELVLGFCHAEWFDPPVDLKP